MLEILIVELLLKDPVSPRQAAEALGVSEASLKRWCDRGLISAVRTAGGHRRLPIGDVLRFVRQQGHPLIRPELLGLPRGAGSGEHSLARVKELMRTAIETGDEEQCRRLLFNLYLGGHEVQEVADAVLAPAFHEIGARWCSGELEIYEERRGVEVCTRALHALRAALPAVPADAPIAVGATLAGDPYTLPSLMSELVLRGLGWNAQSLGIGHPAATLCAAVEEIRPRLLWISVSTVADPDAFLDGYGQVYEAASLQGTPVVVGGRALDEGLRQRMRYTAFCDTLTHLAEFAATVGRLHRTESPATG